MKIKMLLKEILKCAYQKVNRRVGQQMVREQIFAGCMDSGGRG